MMDIGPGDCVEAVRDMGWCDVLYARRGDRDIVERLEPPDPRDDPCSNCGGLLGGLWLRNHQAIEPLVMFCLCGWRKVGPGRDETTRLFAEDLSVRAPETEAV